MSFLNLLYSFIIIINVITDENQDKKIQQQEVHPPIARKSSLTTINEERSSQISTYDSASDMITMVEDKDDVSVSIDGKEISLSLYETPDLSEGDVRQIAEIYSNEISERLSG